MYHIVCFDNTAEVEVVPCSWVKDGVCWWPPYKADNINKAIKNMEEPNNTWAAYNARVLYTANGYHEARRKLHLAEQQSDLQSEAENVSGRPMKRRIKPSRHIIEEDSEEEMGTPKRRPLPKPPTIQKPFKRYLVSGGGCTILPDGESSTDIPEYQHGSSLGSSIRQAIEMANFPEINNDRDLLSQGNVAELSGSVQHQGQSVTEVDAAPSISPAQRLKRTTMCSGMCGSLLHEMLVKQEMIMEQQKNIVRMIQDLHAAFATATREPQIHRHQAHFPLPNVEALMALEREMNTDPQIKTELAITLGLVGGATLKDTVFNILKTAMKNDLAKMVSWRGINGKTSFEKLVLKAVVIDAVRRNPACAAATDAEITAAIKRWFYWAKDREGGRKERMPSTLATEI
ncbi:hypothetical protein ACEWY4_028075 [Coilia grayii]|uniref:DUF4806 domain-containing protein n=1 Tax=Coilia grayii TaxID=363190 RepID=A0ABD1IS51_9TELE